jgi:acetolactate synthase small subunit
MKMNKEIIDVNVVDLLEQIQEIDKLIHVHNSKPNDLVGIFMAKQYTVRREEFVAQLNQVFNKFSLTITLLEPIGISEKAYAPKELLHSFANEPVSAYNTDNPPSL